jgi:hypothetical protein
MVIPWIIGFGRFERSRSTSRNRKRAYGVLFRAGIKETTL